VVESDYPFFLHLMAFPPPSPRFCLTGFSIALFLCRGKLISRDFPGPFCRFGSPNALALVSSFFLTPSFLSHGNPCPKEPLTFPPRSWNRYNLSPRSPSAQSEVNPNPLLRELFRSELFFFNTIAEGHFIPLAGCRQILPASHPSLDV